MDDVNLNACLRTLADHHHRRGGVRGRWRAWVLRRAARIVQPRTTVGS